MAKPYVIALFATNTYYASNTSGIVPTGTNAPPTTLPTVSPSNGWIYADVLGLDPDRQTNQSRYTTPSGNEYQESEVRRHLQCRTLDYYKADYADFDALEAAACGVKRYLYLAIVEYDFIALHGAAEALAVNCKHTPEHEHDSGAKRLILEFTKRTREV